MMKVLLLILPVTIVKNNNSSNVLFTVFSALYIYYLICSSEHMRKWGLTNMPKTADESISPWNRCEAHISMCILCAFAQSQALFLFKLEANA